MRFPSAPIRSPAPRRRRCCCAGWRAPRLPWQPSASLDSPLTPYNPYVTVDFIDNVELNRGVTNNGVGLFGQPLPIERRRSNGRAQPFHAHTQYHLPQYPVPALTDQPQHTFFQHNQDDVFVPRLPFDWLVHLDRPLISPMELIHAACCRPHQVTHLFRDTLNDGYQPFNHAPYWLLRDDTSPLHRAFEFLETGCRAGGAGSSERIPGKINLNSLWDPDVFLSLCDPQDANGFDVNDVMQIYQWMLASRSPGGAPGPNDRPFKSLASANFVQGGSLYAEGNGMNDTLFRANPQHPKYDAAQRPIRLFEIVKQDLFGPSISEHPYQRFELMTKIYSQVTTRSNVFAVWVTVGFFEVNDETVRTP